MLISTMDWEDEFERNISKRAREGHKQESFIDSIAVSGRWEEQ